MAVTILIVHHNMTMQQLLRRTLEQAGYHVVIATTPSEGCELVRETPPSVVIVDTLDEGDGAGISLTQQFPQAKLIALTVDPIQSSHKTPVFSPDGQVLRVVRNPFDVGNLLETMHQILQPSH